MKSPELFWSAEKNVFTCLLHYLHLFLFYILADGKWKWDIVLWDIDNLHIWHMDAKSYLPIKMCAWLFFLLILFVFNWYYLKGTVP